MKLTKYNKILISNKHVNDIYNNPTTKDKLISILFKLTEDEIYSICNDNSDEKGKNKSNEKLKLSLSNESCKCQLIISWDEIVKIRNWFTGYDYHLGTQHWRRCEKLLTRRLEFDQPKKDTINIDDDDDENGVKDEFANDSDSNNEELVKANLIFKYDKTTICPIPLNIHIHWKS